MHELGRPDADSGGQQSQQDAAQPVPDGEHRLSVLQISLHIEGKRAVRGETTQHAGAEQQAQQPAAADIRSQLAWLAPAGFLLTTPRERLQEFPRYLKAIEQRLEKLGRDPRRDAQLAAEVAPIEARYRERVRAERGMIAPGGDEFRWMIEEFRVSLFAQQLGTRSRISARRLADAWVERERKPPK